MLTMTFLGVGAAFAKRNFNSNTLLEYWEKDWTGGPLKSRGAYSTSSSVGYAWRKDVIRLASAFLTPA